MQFNSAGAQSLLLVPGLPFGINLRFPREFGARSRQRSSTERWIDYDGAIR